MPVAGTVPGLDCAQPEQGMHSRVTIPSFASTRVRYLAGSGQVQYRTAKGVARSMDALDWIAQVVSHIPDPGEQWLRYDGWYSNASRGKRRKPGVRVPVEAELQDTPQPDSDGEHFAQRRRSSRPAPQKDLRSRSTSLSPLWQRNARSSPGSSNRRWSARSSGIWTCGSGHNVLPRPSCFLTSWKPLWLLSLPGRPKKFEPPRIRFSGTMSRSGTAEEPRLFSRYPIPVCLLFALFTFIPATLPLSQPGGQALPVMLTIQPEKNLSLPAFRAEIH